MSEADSTAAKPEQSGLERGLDWIGKHWPRVRLAHEGVMVDRVQRVQRIGEVLARNAMTGNMADTNGWPSGDEKMGVDIGDVIHNHYYPPKPEPAAPKPMGNLAKAAIAAALLGTGAGGMAAAPWIAGLFSQGQPPVVSQPQYESGIEVSVSE